MKKAILLGLFCAWAGAVEVQLRAPASLGGGETLPVTAYSQTTPVELTFAQPHNLAAGDAIYCLGMRGNPKARGRLKVKQVLSGVAITVTDKNSIDVPGTTGAGIDIDLVHDGVQVGYCGKLAPFTLNDHPRTVWPRQGSAADLRITDPDGPGPLLAPAVTDDAAGWSFLVLKNNASSTPTCDGRTASLCTAEEGLLTSPTDRITFGYGATMLALGWKMDATRTTWRNAAIYYLNNFEKAFPPARPCFGCFTGVASVAEGDDTEYASFAIQNFAWAYSLMRQEMTEAERTEFARKIWNNKRTGCENRLGPWTGQLSGNGTALTTPDAGSLEAGDVIQIRTAYRQYSIGQGDLLDVTTDGTTAVVHFKEGVPMPRTGVIRIDDSGVTGLNGWFSGTISGQALTFASTAAPGVNQAAGMKILAPGAPSDRTNFHWLKVVSVNRDALPHVVTVNLPVASVAYNSPYGKLDRAWNSTQCGVVWLTSHHESHDIFENLRTARPAAAMTVGQDFVTLTAESWPEFQDLTPPFMVRIGIGEVMRVTGMDPATRRLMVERGQYWTGAAAQSVGSVLWHTPDFGPDVVMSTTEADLITGQYSQNKTNSMFPPLFSVAIATMDDSEEARRFLEHYWNLYYDFYYRIQRRLFAGANYAGPANLGYAFGRWAEQTTMLTLSMLHSFTVPIDLRYPGQQAVVEWGYSLARPGDKKTHLSWGDSGVDRYFEKDEMITLWSAPHLYPSAPETQRARDFYVREWNWLDGPWTEEWIFFRMTYTSSESPRQDYTAGPLARVFSEKEPGIESVAGGLHSRTSWTDPLATLLWAPVVMGGDHNGPYMFPGATIIAKGKPDLISGSSSAAATGNDVRAQYAMQVMKSNGTTVLYSSNSGTSATTVRLQAPAPAGGGLVELTSNSSYVSVPRYATVPEGASTAAVPVRVYQTPTAVTARITLRGTNEVAAYQRVNAATGAVNPQPVSVLSVTLPGPVTAGHFVEATLTLTAPAPTGGGEVLLSANHAGIAVPASIRMKAGMTTTPFFVSAAPTASGTFTLTATGSNSASSGETGIVEASPAPVAVVHFGLATSDTAQGGLRTDGHGRVIARQKIGADFAYMRADNSRLYDKAADAADVAEAHRDILHLKPAAGQDYVLTYDRILHTNQGHQDLLRIPYHRMLHTDGGDAQTPPAEYERNGNDVSFISRQYGVRVNSRVLLPADASTLVDDDSAAHATRLVAYTGQELENEAMAVHQPCPDETCAAPNWRLIPSSSGQRTVQIDDADRTWIVAFTKGTKAAVGSTGFSAAPFSGTAQFVITGLSSVKPFTKYSVMRDGVTLVNEAEVGEDGTLRFDAAFGTSGAFTVTSTGAAPLEILTAAPPQATAGSPFLMTLTGQGGIPPYTWSIASGSLCAGLSLNGNEISGTPGSQGSCSFTVRLTDQSASYADRAFVLNVAAPALTLLIATNSLPSGGLGDPYDYTLSAIGGTPPYTWSLQSGTLPTGLNLNAGGRINGTPANEGDFPLQVKVTDQAGTTSLKTFPLRISVATLVLETQELAPAYARTPYELQLLASGGLAPYMWTRVSGSLPEGFELQSNGMLIGETPMGWSGQVTLRVQDWTGRTQERTFVLKVRSSSGILSARSIAEGRTRLAVRYGRYGLKATDTCQLELRNSGSPPALVESRLDQGGSALRTAVFGETAPLNPGQVYTMKVTCGVETAQAQLQTLAAGLGVPRQVWVEVNPMSLRAGERVGVEYGATGALGQSLELTCQSRCIGSITGLSGEMLYHRTVVWDSLNRVLRRGSVRMTVPD